MVDKSVYTESVRVSMFIISKYSVLMNVRAEHYSILNPLRYNLCLYILNLFLKKKKKMRVETLKTPLLNYVADHNEPNPMQIRLKVKQLGRKKAN